MGADDAAEDALALLEWTAEMASTGLRANALVAPGAAVDAASSLLTEHRPPSAMDVGAAAVYLASDASAALDGVVVVATG